jgi:hypothetical protein
MKQSTHKGTCQVCGAVQKIQNNEFNTNVFTHGFTKREGWWMNDECFGSSHKALEVSCSKVEEAIRRASVSRKNLQADLLSQVKPTSPMKTVLRFYVKGQGTVAYPSTCKKVEEVKHENGATFTNITWLKNDGSEHIAEEFGTIEKVEQKYRDLEIKKLKRQVNDVSGYISDQEEVLANWVAKPLIKI